MKKPRHKHTAARRTALVPAAPATPRTPLDPAKLELGGYDPEDYDWVPVRRRPRVDGWTIERQRAFIGHLADCGSVVTAAQMVGMSAASAYALRRAPGGEGFARGWDVAIHHSARAVVDAAFERAINGSDEPVYDKHGGVIGRRHRQSDGMMMFIMRKHFPDLYGDLGRDRPYETARPPAPVPPVAEAMVAIGPSAPEDPAALLSPAALANAYLNADFASVEPVCDDDEEDEFETEGLGADFEERLEAAKRAADPEGHAACEERRAWLDEQEELDREAAREREDRRMRRRRIP